LLHHFHHGYVASSTPLGKPPAYWSSGFHRRSLYKRYPGQATASAQAFPVWRF